MNLCYFFAKWPFSN